MRGTNWVVNWRPPKSCHFGGRPQTDESVWQLHSSK
jgi:hypothetical protein